MGARRGPAKSLRPGTLSSRPASSPGSEEGQGFPCPGTPAGPSGCRPQAGRPALASRWRLGTDLPTHLIEGWLGLASGGLDRVPARQLLSWPPWGAQRLWPNPIHSMQGEPSAQHLPGQSSRSPCPCVRQGQRVLPTHQARPGLTASLLHRALGRRRQRPGRRRQRPERGGRGPGEAGGGGRRGVWVAVTSAEVHQRRQVVGWLLMRSRHWKPCRPVAFTPCWPPAWAAASWLRSENLIPELSMETAAPTRRAAREKRLQVLK